MSGGKPIGRERNVFLAQSSGNPSLHRTVHYDDRTFAEELIVHGYYRHDRWDKWEKKDKDFGLARPGDVLVQYCTGTVEQSPGRIRYVYRIESVEKIPEDEVKSAVESGMISEDEATRLLSEPHILRLHKTEELGGGVLRMTIKESVEKNELTSAMANCGRLGFNFGRIRLEDFEKLKKLDRVKASELGFPGYEEELRQYLVREETAGKVSEDYSDFTICKDDEGRIIGELFQTLVGEIDILYRTSGNDYLVVELKRSEQQSDKVVGQIARYIGWVKEHLAKGGIVRGAIIAQSHSTKLKYAVKAMPNCRLFSFSMDFSFKPQ